MSKITAKVKNTVAKCIDEYGDEIIIIDRNNTQYTTNAIARRPTFMLTGDATVSEYYFLLAVGEFDRIRDSIGKDATPPPFFGNDVIIFGGQTYVLRKSEPWEYYDGTRQVVRLWGVIKK